MNSFRRILPLLAFAFILSACTRKSPAARAHWTTNFAAAQTQAKAENKLVLLDFTGSDWCEWCQKMDEETLDTKPFTDYADANLVLVELDFPNRNYLSDSVVQQNNSLRGKFSIEGFPTFVVLGPDGKTLDKLEGYQPGGPDAFIVQLKKLAPKPQIAQLGPLSQEVR